MITLQHYSFPPCIDTSFLALFVRMSILSQVLEHLVSLAEPGFWYLSFVAFFSDSFCPNLPFFPSPAPPPSPPRMVITISTSIKFNFHKSFLRSCHSMVSLANAFSMLSARITVMPCSKNSDKWRLPKSSYLFVPTTRSSSLYEAAETWPPHPRPEACIFHLGLVLGY